MLYPTELIYYRDPYLQTLKTEVIRVDNLEGRKINIYFDSTIFFPFGGGQPADQGLVITESGKAEIKNVQLNDNIVRHEAVLLDGEITEGQEAELTLDWKRRHWNMRVHSAGHIIHDVLISMLDGLTPIKGDHGGKPYLEYSPEIDPSIKESLQNKVNQVIQENRRVTTKETNLDELLKIAKFIPPTLPKNKPLRMIQIDGFYAMPDGGTQVASLIEIGIIEIVSISNKEGKSYLKYLVRD